MNLWVFTNAMTKFGETLIKENGNYYK
jgi:hypothetical protein